GASRAATSRNTTSAVGERQMLPRQTKRILIPLLDCVPSSLQASPYRTIVVSPLAAGLLGGHAAATDRGVEPALTLRPAMALVPVLGLLLIGLPVLRVDEQVIARGRLRARGSSAAVRRSYDFILLLRLPPHVVRVVRVVVRDAAKPYGRVERRKHRHKQSERRSHHDESRTPRCVPHSTGVVVMVVVVIHDNAFPRHRAHNVPTRGVVVIVRVAGIHMLFKVVATLITAVVTLRLGDASHHPK